MCILGLFHITDISNIKYAFLIPHFPTHNLFTMLRKSDISLEGTVAKSDLSIYNKHMHICSFKSIQSSKTISYPYKNLVLLMSAEWDNKKCDSCLIKTNFKLMCSFYLNTYTGLYDYTRISSLVYDWTWQCIFFR